MDKVSRLDDLPYYQQNSGPNLTYQYVVKPGEMGLLSSGRVRGEGPTQKALDRHMEWDQIYIVLKGTGTMQLGGEEFPLAAGNIVRIPRGTLHGVRLAEGESLEYLYVNAWKDPEALDRKLKK